MSEMVLQKRNGSHAILCGERVVHASRSVDALQQDARWRNQLELKAASPNDPTNHPVTDFNVGSVVDVVRRRYFLTRHKPLPRHTPLFTGSSNAIRNGNRAWQEALVSQPTQARTTRISASIPSDKHGFVACVGMAA